MTTATSIVMRCDSGAAIGLGHVMRSLALAEELAETHACRVVFAMRGDPIGIDIVRGRQFGVISPPATDRFDYREWLESVVSANDAAALVLDVRDGVPPSALTALRARGCLTVTLDDPTEQRLGVDLAFYPPIPQVREYDWTGFTGRLHHGWEWVVLRRDCARRSDRVSARRPMVLISMGASDPAGLTARAVKALDRLDLDFETLLLVGPAFVDRESLTQALTGSRREVTVCENGIDVLHLMRNADLAIVSFGLTAYELAAQGVPAVHLCLTPDHARSSGVFETQGMAISLGVYTDVSPDRLAGSVADLLRDAPRREHMRRAAEAAVDGLGARRVAAAIERAIAAKAMPMTEEN